MPVSTNTKKDDAYQLIKRAIISGELESGLIYSILELSEKFCVSRTPTREALVVLASEGLIDPIPRSGYMITPITVRNVLDLFQLRRIIEVETIGLAIDQIAEQEIQILERNNRNEREVFRSTQKNSGPDTYRQGYELNTEFHLVLARASGNSRLVALVEQLQVEMERVLARDPYISDPQQHADILEALKKGDKAAAQESMRRHLKDTESRILGRF
jgi:DNA-binding GntR family transcriptional regulator